MSSEGKIEVSRKTLLHISEGIYRTEGSAIKELISNAFDANATTVQIQTNYPLFDVLSCQDNGDGMTEHEFLRIVSGGIGDSPKAMAKESVRPIIGKLGIGVLAIAQICRSFTIISHHEKTRTAFRGKMIFRTDVDQVAKNESIGDSDNNYEIGIWKIEEEIDYSSKDKGVLIITHDLRQAFVRRFKQGLNDHIDKPGVVAIPFNRIIDRFWHRETRSIKELNPYYELIWELANLSPLTYFGGYPIKNEYIPLPKYVGKAIGNQVDFLKKKQEELSSYNFEVFIDNIQLFKPLFLPNPLSLSDGSKQNVNLFYFSYNKVVRKRTLQFWGYLFAQECSIKPVDVKGVQVRIKNVGIGMYDQTFLNYNKIESPRDNWVTGEIFVEEGLDSALNIDRDSFNENDEHYYILREELHKILREDVFPLIRKQQDERNKRKKEKKILEETSIYRSEVESVFEEFLPDDFRVVFSKDHDIVVVDHDYKICNIPDKLLVLSAKKRQVIFSNSIMSIVSGFDILISNKKKLNACISKIASVLLSAK